MKNDNPCYHCPDRYAGCHANCDKYKQWSEQHIEEERRKNAFRAEHDIMRNYSIETGTRIKKLRRDRKK